MVAILSRPQCVNGQVITLILQEWSLEKRVVEKNLHSDDITKSIPYEYGILRFSWKPYSNIQLNERIYQDNFWILNILINTSKIMKIIQKVLSNVRLLECVLRKGRFLSPNMHSLFHIPRCLDIEKTFNSKPITKLRTRSLQWKPTSNTGTIYGFSSLITLKGINK